jgi:hypothetical protein
MTQSPSIAPAPIDWRYAFLGAAVVIAGTAFLGTAMFNLAGRAMLARGASQQEVYSYFTSSSLTVAGAFSLAYSAVFGFLGGRVATMRSGLRSAPAGLAAGVLGLTFQGVMAFGIAPDVRPVWQIVLGVLVPMFGSVLGGASRNNG